MLQKGLGFDKVEVKEVALPPRPRPLRMPNLEQEKMEIVIAPPRNDTVEDVNNNSQM